MKLKRNTGLCLAFPILMLMGAKASAASLEATCPNASDFTPAAAQTLFEMRADPVSRVADPECTYSATHSVTDTDGAEYPDHSFVVGANPGDTTWRYLQSSGDENSPARSTGDLTFEPYVVLASGSPEASVVVDEPSTAASTTFVTCDTLSNRLKYKSPACPGATGAFDLIGCQYNYNAAVPVKNRGIVRVVYYRAGHRGDPAHILDSRRMLCDNTTQRADLKSWFSTTAFRQICRRENYDIPYQTVAGSCQ